MAKVMLITGGSRGIGAAVALQAARAGYKVGVNYHRNEAAARGVVAQIARENGEAFALRADVSRPDEVKGLFSQLDKVLGTLDVLVNNAGVLLVRNIDETDEADLEGLYRSNVFSAYYCSREAVRRMSTRHGGGGGVIINMSSVASRVGSMGVAYAGTKGAVDAFNLALAKETAGQGIRVNAIRPGLITTEMHEANGGLAKMREVAKSVVPIGRAGSASEIADAVLWLASDASSYVHGTFIDVTGGR